ncbi:MAG: protoporphyrinogen/coproporphyrinogen oxidase, partial [Janthinobacterium lividum]
PDALVAQLTARGVTIVTGSAVTAVERRAPDGLGDPGGWVVDTARGSRHADAVVLALPAPVAAALLAAPVPAAARELAGVETASMVIAAFAVPARELAGVSGSGVLVPPVDAITEGLHVKALTLSSNKWGWVAQQSADVSLLRVSLGRAGESQAVEADDADVSRWAVADASRVLGRELHPLDTALMRWVDGLPQYAVGHVARIERLRAAVASVGGLAVCGSVLDGVGIPACVAAATRAAREVLATLPTR